MSSSAAASSSASDTAAAVQRPLKQRRLDTPSTALSHKIPTNLAQKIEMLTMAPTPSCIAMKKAFAFGFDNQMDEFECLRCVVGKPIEKEFEDEMDFPTCLLCLGWHVSPGLDNRLLVRTLRYWERDDGHQESQDIAVGQVCEYCCDMGSDIEVIRAIFAAAP